MISVQIGSEERQLADVDEAWINRKINERFRSGGATCVQVRIHDPGVNIILTTPDCVSGGGGRSPNTKEARILQLWENRGLRKSNYSGGDLVAFLRQVGSYL